MTNLDIAEYLLDRSLTARDMARGRYRIADGAYARREITYAEYLAAGRAYDDACEEHRHAQEVYVSARSA